jgi:hypothetical protein
MSFSRVTHSFMNITVSFMSVTFSFINDTVSFMLVTVGFLMLPLSFQFFPLCFLISILNLLSAPIVCNPGIGLPDCHPTFLGVAGGLACHPLALSKAGRKYIATRYNLLICIVISNFNLKSYLLLHIRIVYHLIWVL